MTWRCEREQCGETYPHKHLCDCVVFEFVENNGNLPQWWCACDHEYYYRQMDEEEEC